MGGLVNAVCSLMLLRIGRRREREEVDTSALRLRGKSPGGGGRWEPSPRRRSRTVRALLEETPAHDGLRGHTNGTQSRSPVTSNCKAPA